MKNKTFKIRPLSLALLLAGIGITQASHAVDLMAVEGEWLPPGGTVGVDEITMWGFTTGTACPGAPGFPGLLQMRRTHPYRHGVLRGQAWRSSRSFSRIRPCDILQANVTRRKNHQRVRELLPGYSITRHAGERKFEDPVDRRPLLPTRTGNLQNPLRPRVG